MKALILAAGFGTRLRPYSLHTPKPLFTINGRALLDHVIRLLMDAGCSEIIINTHHLSARIDAFIDSNAYRIPVHTRHEPEILGTGGAMKNTADCWDQSPFIVINSDIFTDYDLRDIYNFHLKHGHPATLVLHDCSDFNTVAVSEDDFVISFARRQEAENESVKERHLTFTGIQVLDPSLLSRIPDSTFFSSIDLYKSVVENGGRIKAYRDQRRVWYDIGTVDTYLATAYNQMAPAAFNKAFPDETDVPLTREQLQGDGSDRKWYRVTGGQNTLILVDHGIRPHEGVCEVDAFVNIGRHLIGKGVPVPQIYHYDTFSGLVFMADLGDTHLQQIVRETSSRGQIREMYQQIIKLLLRLSSKGRNGFDTFWTYQTPEYDESVIMEKECHYFLDAFVKGYLDMTADDAALESEFKTIADGAVKDAVTGFMHRDLQSRNIMVKADHLYFIDFQGGRMGPFQYDLASLLIDPYAALSFPEQQELLDYATHKIMVETGFDEKRFKCGFYYCALSRNLQILGAFGFLTTVKGKANFEQYIPRAIESLTHYLDHPDITPLPNLKQLVRRIASRCYGDQPDRNCRHDNEPNERTLTDESH